MQKIKFLHEKKKFKKAYSFIIILKKNLCAENIEKSHDFLTIVGFQGKFVLLETQGLVLLSVQVLLIINRNTKVKKETIKI